MQTICGNCPVRQRCANYAVSSNGGRGVDGGFYAGLWLPWKTHGESADIRLMRSTNRRRLKSMQTVDA